MKAIVFILSLTCSITLYGIQNNSLREKIGQLIVAAVVCDEEINKDFMQQAPYRMDKKHIEYLINTKSIGGLIFLGACPVEQLKSSIDYFQSINNNQLLVALDAEYPTMRLTNLPSCLHLPVAGMLGRLPDELVYENAYITGQILRNLGIHMNLAPVADVNNNPANPVIGYRSFGSDPDQVAHKVMVYMNGLTAAGIAHCIKHAPGHGDTNQDSHVTLPVIAHTKEHLKSIELVPFRTAIANGAHAIMMAHLQLPALEPDPTLPASLSKKITTDLMRHELGFKGVIITDGLGMTGVTQYHAPGQLEVKALQAGADILLCPVDVIGALNAIEQAIQNGQLKEEDIDQKLERIATLKNWIKTEQRNSPLTWSQILTQGTQLKELMKVH